MENISDFYSIRYPEIAAVASEDGSLVEVIETFECTGGAMWVQAHYIKSPLVRSARSIGNTSRFILSTGKADLALQGSYFPAGISAVEVTPGEIAVSYLGLGGGGVGASICRSTARGVVRSTADSSGGGKLAGSTIWLPRRQRVIIGVDDTDTPEAGATWTLVHNISKAVADDRSRYLSHTIVQLFPVPYRTKNCVAIAAEFASSEPERLADRFQQLLEENTLSEETGMAVFAGFDPAPLMPFARVVKSGEVKRDDLEAVAEFIDVRIAGRGLIGAVAAIPFYTRYDEALSL